MKDKHTNAEVSPEAESAFTQPPFLYEIRVKGRLSNEQWTSWFDDLTVKTAKGETTLRGRLPDHAALYGLLGRLRDLAVPLVSVRVLDADAENKLQRQSRRLELLITVLMVAIYLAVLGAMITITVFVAPIINTALALTLLFAAIGGTAHAFYLWSDWKPWRWVPLVMWPAAAISFLVYIPVSGVLPVAISLAVVFLLLAGGLVVALRYVVQRANKARGGIVDAGSPSAMQPPAEAAERPPYPEE